MHAKCSHEVWRCGWSKHAMSSRALVLMGSFNIHSQVVISLLFSSCRSSCIYSCYIFVLTSNTPITSYARCFGASPAVGARGALLEDIWRQQVHSRKQNRNNNISAPGWTMIKSRLQYMCERSFTVRCSLFHRELFFCHKPQSAT